VHTNCSTICLNEFVSSLLSISLNAKENKFKGSSLAGKNGYQEELNKKKNVSERKVELEWESEGF
jgi:hypothetical protein